MKRIVLIGVLMVFALSVQAQWVNNTDHTSFNFKAPTGAASIKNEVLFPVADVLTYTTTNDTVTLTIDQMVTFYSTASDSIIADTRFLLTISTQVTAGAQLYLEVPSGHLAQDFLPGPSFIGTTVAGVAHKIKWLSFIYNGTAWINTGAQQIN